MAGKHDPEDSCPGPDSLHSWSLLAILILAYTISFIDRQALTLLVDPIRASLNITDTELSLLHGFAFAIFYTIMGFPLGRIVDQRDRARIVALGIVVWSLMTASCGLARNFWQMFLARIGVGIGEAALSPAAYSMLTDAFSARRLPLAMSIYMSSAHIGGGLAMMIGGALIGALPTTSLPLVGDLEPWRIVFLVIGLPGALVALIFLVVRDPPRRGVRGKVHPSLSDVFRHLLFEKSTYARLIVGYSLAGMVWNGVLAWLPTYFIRVHGWSPEEVGITYGISLILGGMTGVLSGGVIAGGLRRRGMDDANIKVGLLSLAIAAPFGIAGALSGDSMTAFAGMIIFVFASAMPFGAAAAALQEITPNRMRGQITAVYLFCQNLLGIGFGATAVALLTDIVFGSSNAIGSSIALTIAVGVPIAAVVLWLACAPYRAALGRAGMASALE